MHTRMQTMSQLTLQVGLQLSTCQYTGVLYLAASHCWYRHGFELGQPSVLLWLQQNAQQSWSCLHSNGTLDCQISVIT